MCLCSSRGLALVISMVMTAMMHPVRPFFFAPAALRNHCLRSNMASRTFHVSGCLCMAAPGVSVAPPDAIQKALQNPSTTIVDARSIEELQKDGYFDGCKTCRFVHAPCTRIEAPLLELASHSLIPDISAPIVVYCASGIRATTAKSALEKAGYTNVLNAGGLADLEKLVSIRTRRK